MQSFLGSRLQLRAAVDLSPGDEITISYMDCIDTRLQRRRKLQVTYHHSNAFIFSIVSLINSFVGSLIMDSPAVALVACPWRMRTRRPGVSCAARAVQQLTAP